jgi:hypothetical protein
MSHLPTLEQTSKHIKFSPAVSGHLEKVPGESFADNIYAMLTFTVTNIISSYSQIKIGDI